MNWPAGSSLAANIAAAAEPTALGRIVATWPPLAFAVSIELLVIVLSGTAATAPALTDGEDGETAGEDGADFVTRRRCWWKPDVRGWRTDRPPLSGAFGPALAGHRR
jgi:hypothetical protein